MHRPGTEEAVERVYQLERERIRKAAAAVLRPAGSGDVWSGRADDPASTLREVALDLAKFEFDPAGFVRWAFPWPIAEFDGPDVWQEEVLDRIGAKLRAGGDAGAVITEAIRSGHGVGKSTITAWLVLWAISTFENTRGVVTAMTDEQLRTKTWAELAKWHALFIAKRFFTLNALSLASSNRAYARTWRIDAITWSKDATSSFAGTHNYGRRILLVFDEAAEIDDMIFQVARGALTDQRTQIIWVCLGNPTTVTGEFAKMFQHGSRWATTTVDARLSKFSNKALIQEWQEDYGEDSDYFRVRVRGVPPRAGITNFIAGDIVHAARRRIITGATYAAWPMLMSIDPAHFGMDKSVITLRQGPFIHKQYKYSGLDGPDLAGRALDLWRQFPAVKQILVESMGVGVSCADTLARIPNLPLVRVNTAIPAKDDDTYANVRAEIWGRMRIWLKSAAIPDDEELCEQLVAMNYGLDGQNRILLESKKDMRRKGKSSPDCADSLAISFASEVIMSSARTRAIALPTARRPVIWRQA